MENGLHLVLAATELDFGDRIDGLIGYRGIARLEEEHGLVVSHSEEMVTFQRPAMQLISLTKQWEDQEERRLANVNRVRLEGGKDRWSTSDKTAVQSLSKASLDKAARFPPAEFAEVIRSFIAQGNYAPE